MLGDECLDLGSPRHARRATEPSAFDPGHRGAEAHGFDFALAFGKRQRKAAVEGVAGANRVDGSDAEYRQAPHRVALEIEDIFRPVAHGD